MGDLIGQKVLKRECLRSRKARAWICRRWLRWRIQYYMKVVVLGPTDSSRAANHAAHISLMEIAVPYGDKQLHVGSFLLVRTTESTGNY